MQKVVNFFLLFLLLLITACQKNIEPTEITDQPIEETLHEKSEEDLEKKFKEDLDEDLSGMIGFALYTDKSPIANEVIRLGEVIWNEDKSDGNFVIDGAWSPSTISDENGFFSFINVEPGEYVIVVRDINTNPIIVPDPEVPNNAAIYKMEPNEINNIGTIVLDPDS